MSYNVSMMPLKEWHNICYEFQIIIRHAWKKLLNSEDNNETPTKAFEKILAQVEIHEKTKLDFVTQYDQLINTYLIENIIRQFDFNIETEEVITINGNTGSKIGRGSDYTVIIDPIDGTTNFINGIHHFSTAIAVIDRNRNLHMGIVFNPITMQMYYSVGNQESFCDGKQIWVRNEGIKNNLVILSDEPSNKIVGTRIIKELATLGFDYRIYGSAQLDICQVASGKATGYIKTHASDWDILAGMFISQHAGATCTLTENHDIVVSNADNMFHQQLLSILNSALTC